MKHIVEAKIALSSSTSVDRFVATKSQAQTSIWDQRLLKRVWFGLVYVTAAYCQYVGFMPEMGGALLVGLYKGT